MRIAKRRIGNQQALLFSRPRGKFLRTKLLQELTRSCWRRNAGSRGNNRRFEPLRRPLPFHFGIAVEDDVADIGEKFGGAVTAAREAEKFRRLVKKRRRDFAGTKLRMVHDVLDERNIRLYTPNTELAKSAVHALAGFGKIRAPSRDFDKQRVVIGSEHRAGVRGTPVQSNPKTSGRTVSRNFPIVGGEVFLRVFGGHPALQRCAIEWHAFLRWQRERRLMQPMSLRNQNLRTNEIDARHHFRYGVLHLDARIDFDEIPLPRIDVVKKLHRPDIAVILVSFKLHRRVAKFASNTGEKIRSGSDLDNLLMPSLHRAVTFV